MLLDIIKTPFGFELPDFGGQGEPPAEGSSKGLETVAPTDDGQGGVPESFFDYEDPSDKKKYTFPDKDSLTKHIVGRGYTQAQFTKKCQDQNREHEMRTLKFENDRKSFHSQYEEAQKTIEEKKRIDEFFKANPKAYQQIRTLINPQDGIKSEMEKHFEEKYGKDITELKQKLSEKELLEQLTGFDEELKGEFEDYDPEQINTLFSELSKPEATPKDLKRMLYFASKGQTDPVKLQERMVEAAEKKKRAGLVSGTGKVPDGPSPKSFEDVRRKHRQQE